MGNQVVVEDSKTYHVIRDGYAYHFVKSEVKDVQGDAMWLKIKECYKEKKVLDMGYVSKPIVQMAIDGELTQGG